MKYNFKKIEPKWQAKWEESKVFEAKDNSDKPKFYGLVEFPYPSGAGMHVGHIKAYSSLEVISRKRRMEGYNVLFPIGFDAFGLPTENYAVKTGTHPRIITDENIKKFSNQLKKVGFSFDWNRVIDTTDEDYYKWTQWIFLKMFEKGLVFRDRTLVNYCPHCKVVLSNEDSQGGKCDICHSEVVQKSKDVWYLRITQYADKLLEGLKDVDYPDNVKQQQIHWIGKSKGAFVNFDIDGIDEKLEIYTTRPDTLFGVTFMVMAPEHPLIEEWKDLLRNMDEVSAYQAEAAKKSDFERTEVAKDKTGVRLEGVAAIHPLTGKEIPIFISDYVLVSYGTGAIMAVPAHDTRDWEFAKRFDLPIVEVVAGGHVEREPFTDCQTGTMVNSDFLNGKTVEEAKEAIIAYLTEHGIGEKKTNYKLRDWVFARQRYWGEPIPVVFCDKCGCVPVPESELPVRLPNVKSYEPTDSGESPLAAMTDWVNTTCPHCGGPARRETDTMPQWAGSSWYNGGMEHTTLHLLYSRFWHKFLYDIGVVPTPEPYAKRTSHGMVLGEGGEKMSKSRGNVVNPDDIVAEFGADTLRLYEMFIGDFEKAAPWSTNSVRGCRRFLDRVWSMGEHLRPEDGVRPAVERSVHRTIRKVSEDVENLKYNTAIAALMSLVNDLNAAGGATREEYRILLLLLNPFSPHMTEELWQQCGYEGVLSSAKWPTYDESKCREETVEIAVQVSGKIRARLNVPAEASAEEVIALAKDDERIAAEIAGKALVRELYVPGKLVNLVVKP